MSEREKLDNARRKGKKAFWEGVPWEQNPMRAADSRQYWYDAWKEEERRAKLPPPIRPPGKS